jgi:hypothetical protein
MWWTQDPQRRHPERRGHTSSWHPTPRKSLGHSTNTCLLRWLERRCPQDTVGIRSTAHETERNQVGKGYTRHSNQDWRTFQENSRHTRQILVLLLRYLESTWCTDSRRSAIEKCRRSIADRRTGPRLQRKIQPDTCGISLDRCCP